MGDYRILVVPGSSGEGSEGCFCGVLGRFRAFSDGYRATTPGKLMEMSPEGTGRVFGGSRGGLGAVRWYFWTRGPGFGAWETAGGLSQRLSEGTILPITGVLQFFFFQKSLRAPIIYSRYV